MTGCNPDSEIYNLTASAGVLAQLVERLNGIEEVTGSNPVGSILLLVFAAVAANPAVTNSQRRSNPNCGR